MGNLNIKNLPDELHAALRARATSSRMSIRDYVLRLLERDLAKPSLDEWLREQLALPADPLAPGWSGEEVGRVIADGWDERDAHLAAAEHAPGYDAAPRDGTDGR